MGSVQADQLTGDGFDNLLYGLAGDDTLSGGDGDDYLVGGAGRDSLDGGAGDDVVDYVGSPQAVTVDLQAGTGSGGHAEGDRLSGIENLLGSEHSDRLTGNGGDNRLFGFGGNDTLVGGGGNDILTGGPGNDMFVFASLSDMGVQPEACDQIQDFVQGEDRIDLSGIDANAATGANDTFHTLIDPSAAFTTAGQLRFHAEVLYGNTDADAEAEFVINLIGVTSLTLSDFVL
jgi:Ca2+-binding RTX toxin-like protein